MILQNAADFVAAVRRVSVPEAALHAARRCVVDWFAATVPGGVMPPATLLAEAFAEDLDHGNASLVPSGRRTTARTAALINGVASHTVEFDDIYRDAIFHPGAPAIPAALATAQSNRASGGDFLRAVIAGYEISTRIGVAVTPAHYEYWHTTGTVGTFGAAAAASVLVGLDGEAARHALANAATLAAGLQQAFRADAMSKPLHAGHAAECGVLVAQAAAKGVTGAADILEGERGFGRAMAGAPEWETAFETLGSTWNITRVTQKNHAACGHTHAAVDGVLALKAEHGLRPDDVRRISVGTYAKALEITGNADPKTAFEAKFSLPYCVAAALTTGRVRSEAFAPRLLDDPALRGLMSRVHLFVDADAEAKFPKARSTVVEIETVTGERLRWAVPTRKGDPDNPLSNEELSDKFTELVTPVLGEARASELLDLLWRTDALADLRSLPLGEPRVPLARTKKEAS